MSGEVTTTVSSTPEVGRRFYRTNETPPLATLILSGIQQIMVCVSALLTIPFIISNELCPGKDLYYFRVKLISSTFIVSGISTIIQTALGMRHVSAFNLDSFLLALLQGTAFAYVPSIQAFMQLEEYKCKAADDDDVSKAVYGEKMAIVGFHSCHFFRTFYSRTISS
ncbi:unnamed protein product [Enterobius vermicularis]|uniref:Purine permease 10 n=1 Tax=Enterobius vermicularis TaxID=51028 RepID=A0A0N4VPB6_ENTVE|nr:unnamed protein product [Enterobius vermicularis]